MDEERAERATFYTSPVVMSEVQPGSAEGLSGGPHEVEPCRCHLHCHPGKGHRKSLWVPQPCTAWGCLRGPQAGVPHGPVCGDSMGLGHASMAPCLVSLACTSGVELQGPSCAAGPGSLNALQGS